MKSQRGMSTLGMLILASYGALVVLLVVKLFPVYMDDFTIKDMLSSMQESPDVRGSTPEGLRDLFRKRLDVNGIRSVSHKDLKVERDGDLLKYELTYEIRTPMVANIDVVTHFSHQYELKTR